MRRLMPIAAILVWMALPAGAGPLLDPRADPYFADAKLRALMDWVTFQLTFDAGSMTPDMAAGEPKFTQGGAPQFEPGV